MGIDELDVLLREMQPRLAEGEFVFATAALFTRAVCIFHEREGVTLILPKSEAEGLGLAYTLPCRMITLEVPSSLEAVGFLARMSAELAKQGISVNAVSAFHHDHLFVPMARAQEALERLHALQRTG